MTEQDLRDAEWSRKLLARTLRLVLLKISWEFAELAKSVQE
jgi:hypothetical protein